MRSPPEITEEELAELFVLLPTTSSGRMGSLAATEEALEGVELWDTLVLRFGGSVNAYKAIKLARDK